MRRLPPFSHLKWDPDRAERQSFARAMGIGFLLLGLLAAWRGGGFGGWTYGLWSVGLLLAGGALVPGLGRSVYLAVYVPVSLIGYVVSHVLLIMIFFLVFLPVGLVVRWTGNDLLGWKRPRGGPSWLIRNEPKGTESYYQSF